MFFNLNEVAANGWAGKAATAAGVVFSGQNFLRAQSRNCETATSSMEKQSMGLATQVRTSDLT